MERRPCLSVAQERDPPVVSGQCQARISDRHTGHLRRAGKFLFGCGWQL